MKTSRFNLNLLHNNQANKELLVNENMNLLDHFMHPSVKSSTITIPPSSPDYGDIYIVPTGVSEWRGQEGSFALFMDEWIYLLPKSGMMAWIEGDNELSLYDGKQWILLYSRLPN